MTPETAKILARALYLQAAAADKLIELRDHIGALTPELVALADIYVHEQRIINRIVAEATD